MRRLPLWAGIPNLNLSILHRTLPRALDTTIVPLKPNSRCKVRLWLPPLKARDNATHPVENLEPYDWAVISDLDVYQRIFLNIWERAIGKCRYLKIDF